IYLRRKMKKLILICVALSLIGTVNLFADFEQDNNSQGDNSAQPQGFRERRLEDRRGAPEGNQNSQQNQQQGQVQKNKQNQNTTQSPPQGQQPQSNNQQTQNTQGTQQHNQPADQSVRQDIRDLL
ncbi:MAG: hypothetical protein WCR55_10555, partial [Lentisphaerota bacterium]